MGTNCNNTTGICEAGCEEHWREPKCDGNFFFFNFTLMIIKRSRLTDIPFLIDRQRVLKFSESNILTHQRSVYMLTLLQFICMCKFIHTFIIYYCFILQILSMPGRILW